MSDTHSDNSELLSQFKILRAIRNINRSIRLDDFTTDGMLYLLKQGAIRIHVPTSDDYRLTMPMRCKRYTYLIDIELGNKVDMHLLITIASNEETTIPMFNHINFHARIVDLEVRTGGIVYNPLFEPDLRTDVIASFLENMEVFFAFYPRIPFDE